MAVVLKMMIADLKSEKRTRQIQTMESKITFKGIESFPTTCFREFATNVSARSVAERLTSASTISRGFPRCTAAVYFWIIRHARVPSVLSWSVRTGVHNVITKQVEIMTWKIDSGNKYKLYAEFHFYCFCSEYSRNKILRNISGKIGVSSKWSKTFIEFSEADNSLEHVLGSIWRFCLLPTEVSTNCPH